MWIASESCTSEEKQRLFIKIGVELITGSTMKELEKELKELKGLQPHRRNNNSN